MTLARYVAVVAIAVPAASSLKVCSVLENGFNMLQPGVAADEVTSDEQLRGFDVDVRREVLRDYNYSVRALSSYGQVNTLTRAAECDVGWAPFFHTSSRERCVTNQATCRPLPANVSTATPPSWEPFRCCVDFTTLYLPSEVAIMYIRPPQKDFFAAVALSMSDAFFVNFLSFVFISLCLLFLEEGQSSAVGSPREVAAIGLI